TDGRGSDGSVRRLAAGGFQAFGDFEAGQAGARPAGRPPDALQRPAWRIGAVDRLDQPDDRLLAEPLRPARRFVEEDGSMSETKSVIVERELPVPPEKLWRALTQPHLIADWLMQNDFAAMAGHRFQFTADWGSVDCQVLTVEENRTLSY